MIYYINLHYYALIFNFTGDFVIRKDPISRTVFKKHIWRLENEELASNQYYFRRFNMAGENSVLYQSDSTTIRVIESAINREEYVSVGVEFVCNVSVINAIIVRLCEMGQNLPQFPSISISREVSSLPNNDENIDIASIVNKQLTIPLRRLNPHNISHLTNNQQQDNISNMLPNSPMPIEQVMNDVDRQIIDVAVDNYHTTSNPNANNRLIIPADYMSSQRVIEEESNTSRPSTIPTISSTEAISEDLMSERDGKKCKLWI